MAIPTWLWKSCLMIVEAAAASWVLQFLSVALRHSFLKPPLESCVFRTLHKPSSHFISYHESLPPEFCPSGFCFLRLNPDQHSNSSGVSARMIEPLSLTLTAVGFQTESLPILHPGGEPPIRQTAAKCWKLTKLAFGSQACILGQVNIDVCLPSSNDAQLLLEQQLYIETM